MKILIINSLYAPNIIGGAEISSQKLAEGLRAADHEVFVLATGNEDSQEILNGVSIIRRRFSNIMSFWDFKHGPTLKRILYKILDVYNPLNEKEVTKVLREIKPDVIHLNTIYGITPVVWECAAKMNIPVVQTLRDYYFMCPRANLLHRNGCECSEKINSICKMFRCFHIQKAQKINAVTAPSCYTLNRFINAGYFKNAYKQVIYNAIDFKMDRLKEMAELRLRKRSNEVHVVYIGSFIETKGIQFLLDAVKLTPNNVVFHFAGKGAMLPDIERTAKDTGRVVVEGFLNEQELLSLLEKMDLLVCPSIWAEPFGRVVIDAYKSYLPVVVTNCGGLPELVEDGITGMIIVPNDPDAIAEGIMKVARWEFTEERRKGFDRKLNEFSIETQVDKFVELYHTVTQGQ